jgi:hypothetical protein
VLVDDIFHGLIDLIDPAWRLASLPGRHGDIHEYREGFILRRFCGRGSDEVIDAGPGRIPIASVINADITPSLGIKYRQRSSGVSLRINSSA